MKYVINLRTELKENQNLLLNYFILIGWDGSTLGPIVPNLEVPQSLKEGVVLKAENWLQLILIITILAIKQFYLEYHIRYHGVKNKQWALLSLESHFWELVTNSWILTQGPQMKASILAYQFPELSSSLLNFFWTHSYTFVFFKNGNVSRKNPLHCKGHIILRA